MRLDHLAVQKEDELDRAQRIVLRANVAVLCANVLVGQTEGCNKAGGLQRGQVEHDLGVFVLTIFRMQPQTVVGDQEAVTHGQGAAALVLIDKGSALIAMQATCADPVDLIQLRLHDRRHSALGHIHAAGNDQRRIANDGYVTSSIAVRVGDDDLDRGLTLDADAEDMRELFELEQEIKNR